MAGKNPKLSALAQLANKDTNLRNAPMRYMDHASFLAGTPLEYGEKYHSREPNYDKSEYDAWGLVDKKRPKEVYLSEWDFSNPENLKTLAHEGTHSKQVIARNKTGLKEISPDLMDSIKYLMESNPKFLREYLGHDSDTRSFKDITDKSMEELLSSDEVMSRLQAIEAMSPKGQMLEKSKYANDLFGSEQSVDDYLAATNPEGYIRANQSRTFREIPNQTTANPNKGVLEILKGLIK